MSAEPLTFTTGEYDPENTVATFYVTGWPVPLTKDEAWKLAWALIGACVNHGRGASEVEEGRDA